MMMNDELSELARDWMRENKPQVYWGWVILTDEGDDRGVFRAVGWECDPVAKGFVPGTVAVSVAPCSRRHFVKAAAGGDAGDGAEYWNFVIEDWHVGSPPVDTEAVVEALSPLRSSDRNPVRDGLRRLKLELLDDPSDYPWLDSLANLTSFFAFVERCYRAGVEAKGDEVTPAFSGLQLDLIAAQEEANEVRKALRGGLTDHSERAAG